MAASIVPVCNHTVEIVKKWLPVAARPGLKELKAEWIKRDAKFAGHRAQTLRALALPGMLALRSSVPQILISQRLLHLRKKAKP